MGIDFHNENNLHTYSKREADQSWKNTVAEIIQEMEVKKAADIGCGGGIYSKALVQLGFEEVIGIDYSEVSLEGARENCKEYPSISFRQGDALDNGLEKETVDLLIERALIHHIKDIEACFTEAYRVVKNGGRILVQDRTPEDCFLQGNAVHIRGLLFDCFPKLKEIELSRRYTMDTVINQLNHVGFHSVQTIKLWETRYTYASKEELIQDIAERTGRSILHELNDRELNQFISHVEQAVPSDQEIVEKDRWTIWTALKG